MDIGLLFPRSLFRSGLASLLSSMGFANVEEAVDLDDLKTRANGSARPDIILVGQFEGDERIGDTLAEIRAWAPNTQVIVFSELLDVELLSKSFAAGASGFLMHSISRNALQESLELVLTGEKVFPSELASIMPQIATRLGDRRSGEAALRRCNLSAREVEILRQLARGQSNKAIAAELDITDSTVKVHLKRILRKIRLSNRTQAALWAVEHGLIEPAQPQRAHPEPEGEAVMFCPS